MVNTVLLVGSLFGGPAFAQPSGSERAAHCVDKATNLAGGPSWGLPPWEMDESQDPHGGRTGYDDLPRPFAGARPFPTEREVQEAASVPSFDSDASRLVGVSELLPPQPPDHWAQVVWLDDECNDSPSVELRVSLSSQAVSTTAPDRFEPVWTLTQACSSLAGSSATVTMRTAPDPGVRQRAIKGQRVRLRLGSAELESPAWPTFREPFHHRLLQLPPIFDSQTEPAVLVIEVMENDVVVATGTFDLAGALEYRAAVAAACRRPDTPLDRARPAR